MMFNLCNEENCQRRVFAKRLCKQCYQRMWISEKHPNRVRYRPYNMTIEEVVEYFLSLAIQTENGCLLVDNSIRGVTIKRKGYPAITFNGKSCRLHRIVLEVKIGRPLKYSRKVSQFSEMCLHNCDTPNCINPDHLFLGTQKDNMIDCLSKGRLVSSSNLPHNVGEDSGNVKLTEKQVLKIRSLRDQGQTLKCIADQFSVSFSHIYKIVKRECWTHI